MSPRNTVSRGRVSSKPSKVEEEEIKKPEVVEPPEKTAEEKEAELAAREPETPAAERPAAEQPAAEQPAAEQPAAEQPAAEQPAAEPAKPVEDLGELGGKKILSITKKFVEIQNKEFNEIVCDDTTKYLLSDRDMKEQIKFPPKP